MQEYFQNAFNGIAVKGGNASSKILKCGCYSYNYVGINKETKRNGDRWGG